MIWTVAGGLVFLWLADRFVYHENARAIFFKPSPDELRIDGELVPTPPDGPYKPYWLHGYHGSTLMHVSWSDGRERIIRLYPRPSDNDSSTAHVSPEGVAMQGDVRYESWP